LALVSGSPGQVVVFNRDGTSLAPWPAAGGPSVRSVRGIDDTHLVATLDPDGDEVLLTVPTSGTALSAGQALRAHSASALAVVTGASGVTEPLTVGLEQAGDAGLQIAARLALADTLARMTPDLDPAPGGFAAVTAAAWRGREPPVFGLADGRLWVRPAPGAPYTAIPATVPNDDPKLVRAMAQRRSVFAFAVTFDGNNVHVRKTAQPDADAMAALDAGAPATALQFSPQGDLLAAGTSAGNVRVWRVRVNAGVWSADRQTDLPFPDREVQGLAFWPGRSRLSLAALNRRGQIMIWTTTDPTDPAAFEGGRRVTPEPPPTSPDRTASLVWSPPGTKLAVASQEGQVFILDAP
jgi:hypothetical protein